ncbi:MAG: histidinol-phosphate transaminase [Omnitrophica bacterium RBG_13_46_9]|nr:MAG: histidinol-phosphate transaminase [Omnitrophica bacterium RBG_13_46_9]
MEKLAKESILKIKSYIPGKPIEEVKRELRLKSAVKLASNENALPPSKKVVRAAKRALMSLNRYPDGNCFYLKRALADRFRMSPDNVIIGNGSDEIIVLTLRAFLRSDEEVIIARPTFLIYEIASQIEGAKVKFVPLKNFRYDIPGIVRLISDKTKVIFIANPDNPTGTYVTKKEINFLISRAPRDTILYFDEAYFEFAKDVSDYPDTIKYLSAPSGKGKNIIVTRSFSKIYSLAGARVGYGVAKRSIIDCLNRVREPFNVNSVAQEAALAALDDKRHIERTLRLVKKGKFFLYKKLDSLGIGYIPSVTNFILIDMGKQSKDVYKKLLEHGVIVREMSPWRLNNFIRVTIGTMDENRRFIRALKKIL